MNSNEDIIKKFRAVRDDENSVLLEIKKHGAVIAQFFNCSPIAFTSYCRSITANVLQSLLGAGVSPALIDCISDCTTCLGHAIHNPQPGVIKLLLLSGCDPYAPYLKDTPHAYGALQVTMHNQVDTGCMLAEQMIEINPMVVHEEKFKNILMLYPKGVSLLEREHLRQATPASTTYHPGMRF